MPSDFAVKKLKQMSIRNFLYFFIFGISIGKISAQQTFALANTNNKIEFHNPSSSHHLSFSESQNIELNNYNTSKQSFVFKNHKATTLFNTNLFHNQSKTSFKLTGPQGAIIGAVIGGLVGYYAITNNAHPTVPTLTKVYGTFAGAIAIAPIGYVLCIAF